MPQFVAIMITALASKWLLLAGKSRKESVVQQCHKMNALEVNFDLQADGCYKIKLLRDLCNIFKIWHRCNS